MAQPDFDADLEDEEKWKRRARKSREEYQRDYDRGLELRYRGTQSSIQVDRHLLIAPRAHCGSRACNWAISRHCSCCERSNRLHNCSNGNDANQDRASEGSIKDSELENSLAYCTTLDAVQPTNAWISNEARLSSLVPSTNPASCR